jgi:autotransporter-associated beta strand protein
MNTPMTMNRRTLLRGAVLSAGAFAVAPVPSGPFGSAAQAATTPAAAAFVDAYRTNVMANLTADTNAAVRVLSGMARLWQTGTAWNAGTPLERDVLRASMRHVARTTRSRTTEQAGRAFILDRQHQSYAVIAGLGPLAPVYRTGALAVTSITSAPDGTPPAQINDAVPADAPAGAAIGAGSPASALGAVVTLVNTLRGPYASGNPSKYAYQYPRPWRMTEESRVVDTGVLDALGYPVYRSDVVVAPQLLRQRSTSPADDAGYPSGHTNAFHLAALALAYAIPERFQELVATAYDLSDSRIVAGMHSPVDVIGGRILATALAAATLADPANAAVKAAARAQAAAYLQAQTGTTADTLFAYAHSAGPATDPYADRAANERSVALRSTYHLPAGHRPAGECGPATIVPKGAEVLLETRLPYLDANQRREVLRTTAFDGGHPLLDGPEQWGRLNLFAAADGFGSFAGDVTVTLEAALGGFLARDTWRNDIDGPGGLLKRGSGELVLAGANSYRGGTVLVDGTLTAGSGAAFGTGDLTVLGGDLAVPAGPGLRIRRTYEHRAGILSAALTGSGPAVTVGGEVTLGRASVLRIAVDGSCRRAGGAALPVIRAGRLSGRFARIEMTTAGYRAEAVYSRTGLSIRLHAA